MQRVLDGAERGAHQAAAGAGRRGRRHEGERRRGAGPRHQGRQHLQEDPQGPHRAGQSAGFLICRCSGLIGLDGDHPRCVC